MIQVFLIFLLVSAIFVVWEQKVVRMIIFLGIFSLIASVCFLLLAAPDVAMAEAVVSTFSTIIFIVAFEKYYSFDDISDIRRKAAGLKKHILPLGFVAFLLALFIWFVPDDAANTYLKDLYVSKFSHDVGGENSVTAIYLGYRMYDTLFEALMLLISIVAVVHLSWHGEGTVPRGKSSEINRSGSIIVAIRMICPILIMFGVYLIMNGHISPGGGFQGGVILAAFFICRYMIYDIYDMHIIRVITLEKLIYVGIILLSAFFIFSGVYAYLPIPKNIYLILMNLLIAMKVACGFLVIFYRFIAVERR